MITALLLCHSTHSEIKFTSHLLTTLTLHLFHSRLCQLSSARLYSIFTYLLSIVGDIIHSQGRITGSTLRFFSIYPAMGIAWSLYRWGVTGMLQAILHPRCMVIVRTVKIRVRVGINRVKLGCGTEHSTCHVYLSVLRGR